MFICIKDPLKNDESRRAPKPRGFCEGEKTTKTYATYVEEFSSEARVNRVF